MDSIFALDIGTRKIVGLVMQKRENSLVVLDSEMREHKTRAMIDGQIHDVEAVAATIQEIKSSLETRMDTKLQAGAVAAAGRALQTAMGSAVQKRPTLEEISREEVLALEVEAVQKAQFALAGEDRGDNKEYFCVGYSVGSYYLNEQKIGSLIGQIGNSIAAHVIATFLPRVVVDSLFSSLKRADLDILSLTLEPIAALSVAIPANMRLLNLALVDIGAGTADIAIVKDSNIFAYAMVPMGGDKLTEFIAKEFLLDFNEAEMVKRQLKVAESLDIIDVLGNKTTIESSAIIDHMEVATKELVQKIAHNILELNQKSPDAVILIGGGSMTPNLTSMLAKNLNLAPNRVGLRSPESLEELVINSDFLKSPQGVTPLGIAYYSLTSKPVPFVKVQVNKREIVLWNTGNINISQALLSSGIALNNIYGKPGLGKTIEVNGLVKVFKGKMGTLPLIKLNGADAALDTLVNDGDVIEFERGTDGEEALILQKDLIPPSQAAYVYVNGEKISLVSKVYVNGEISGEDIEIPDRAKVEYKQVDSLYNVLSLHGIADLYLQEKIFNYKVNGQDKVLNWNPLKVFINDKPAKLSDTISLGDNINYSLQSLQPKIKEALQGEERNFITVEVNGKKAEIITAPPQIKNAGKIISLEDDLQDKMSLEFIHKTGAILSDVFRVIDLNLASKGRLIMTVDGQKAGFTTPIMEGSKIELLWE